MKNNLKNIIVLFSLLVLSACGTFANKQIDYSKELNTNFKTAKNHLLSYGFVQKETTVFSAKNGINKYTFVYDKVKGKDNSVILYATSENANLKFVEIKQSTLNLNIGVMYHVGYSAEKSKSSSTSRTSGNKTKTKGKGTSQNASFELNPEIGTSLLYSENIYSLHKEDFAELQKQAGFLSCSADPDFLTKNFKCSTEYTVTGKKEEGFSWLGIFTLRQKYNVTIKVSPK